jgi:hypothetical protein
MVVELFGEEKNGKRIFMLLSEKRNEVKRVVKINENEDKKE